jgi:deoxycytidine triphosphate deaminase
VAADLQPSSVLSDATIRELIETGRIVIDPFDPSMVQPASVDIRLGDSFRVFHNHRIQSIDLGNPPRDLTEHVEIADDGEFVIHPGEFVLGRTHELVEIPDDVVCRIEGKALALDTEIPTPDGWTTMGEIEAGDHVFGPCGNPRQVVAATEVMHDRPCFEIGFADGTTVIADADHQWRVFDRHRPKARIVTSREIFQLGVRSGKRDYRFRIPEALPIQYAEKDLPVELAGYAVRHVSKGRLFNIGGAPRSRDEQTGRFAANGSLHSILKRERILGAKTLPDQYLQASIDQRWALLEGLMDTDGYVDESTGTFNYDRAIVSIREVASVPVRCIEVDSADGLYLITRRFITTHNSSIGRLGLVVHATAGFVDPGFKGTLTLEITNFNSVPIVLRPGLPICQLSFMALDRPAERPYGHPDLGSHYYGQVEATESRYRS